MISYARDDTTRKKRNKRTKNQDLESLDGSGTTPEQKEQGDGDGRKELHVGAYKLE